MFLGHLRVVCSADDFGVVIAVRSLCQGTIKTVSHGFQLRRQRRTRRVAPYGESTRIDHPHPSGAATQAVFRHGLSHVGSVSVGAKLSLRSPNICILLPAALAPLPLIVVNGLWREYWGHKRSGSSTQAISSGGERL